MTTEQERKEDNENYIDFKNTLDCTSLIYNPTEYEENINKKLYFEKTEIKFTKEQIINTMHQVELEDDKDYSKLFNRVLQKLNEL